MSRSRKLRRGRYHNRQASSESTDLPSAVATHLDPLPYSSRRKSSKSRPCVFATSDSAPWTCSRQPIVVISGTNERPVVAENLIRAIDSAAV